ncbi:MAG: class I SAM-dependent methyltransferase, partial [Pyrinomonadaceae bacterium]
KTIRKKFNELWDDEKSIEASEFTERWQERSHEVKRRVNYEKHWLLKYDRELSPHDRELKNSEFELVRNVLQKKGLWGEIRNHLDVGTCTGRYLLGLREAVSQSEKGYSIGIDNDIDCVELVESKIKDIPKAAFNRKIEALKIDIIHDEYRLKSKNFDLITCMMGTISHLGYDISEDYIQKALDRMSNLLSENGLLIISNWSDIALEKYKRYETPFLSIYNDHDNERLYDWTPNAVKLEEKLKKSDLEIVNVKQTRGGNLDIYFCQHQEKSNALS